jgi:DNA-binding winged helix-turn-helix (wHTH) protein/Tfp pilus assembly protein PilF
MNRLLGFGPFRLDTVSRVLTQKGQLIPLPSKAIEVLLILVQRHGEVVSKDDLMNGVWPDAFVEEGNLTQHIHLLRRALQDKAEEHRYILTIPGRGYSFVASVQEIAEGQPQEPSRLRNQVGEVKNSTGAANTLRHFVRRNVRLIPIFVFLVFATIAAFVEFLPRVARHLNNRGVELQGKGELQSAVDEYRRALMLKPSYAEARYNLADAYEEIPDYDKAIEEYQKAIDSDVTLYPAYNNLARLYILRRKDPAEALRLIEHGLSSNPQEESVRYSLLKNAGWANLELGNYTRADRDLRHAMELQPNHGAAHCLLAKLLRAEGGDAEAKSQWESCLGFSNQPEVEPEWRDDALEQLSKKGAMK